MWAVDAGEGAYGSDEEPEAAAGARPRKKARTKQPKQKKAYAPGYRTAGYAFMVVLFKEHANGKEFLKKEELMRAAEESGIAQKPIRGAIFIIDICHSSHDGSISRL